MLRIVACILLGVGRYERNADVWKNRLAVQQDRAGRL